MVILVILLSFGAFVGLWYLLGGLMGPTLGTVFALAFYLGTLMILCTRAILKKCGRDDRGNPKPVSYSPVDDASPPEE